MNAKDILKYGQFTVLQAIDGFPETAWGMPGACGAWSARDIIAHLASYEEVLVDVLSGFSGGHLTPSLDTFTELCSHFNDTEVEKRKGSIVKEALDEFNDAHAQVLSLAEQLCPDVFRQ